METLDNPSTEGGKARAEAGKEARVTTPHDIFARWVAVLGLTLSLAGLLWQVISYRESLAERILLRVSLHRLLGPEEDTRTLWESGDVDIEIVNLGRQPLYIREVRIDNGRTYGSFATRFDSSDNTPVAPGARAFYRVEDFYFRDYAVSGEGTPPLFYPIVVETTKDTVFRERVRPELSFAAYKK